MGPHDHAVVDSVRRSIGLLDEGRPIGHSLGSALDAVVRRSLHIDHLERLARLRQYNGQSVTACLCRRCLVEALLDICGHSVARPAPLPLSYLL